MEISLKESDFLGSFDLLWSKDLDKYKKNKLNLFVLLDSQKFSKKDNIPSRCVLWLSCSIQNQHTGRNVILP